MTAASLRGRRIILTRAPDDARPWAQALANLGALPVIFPCLSVVMITDEATRAALRAAVDDADWLLFFSRRGVQAAGDLLAGVLPSRVSLGAVGDVTAAAVRDRFGRSPLVPAVGTAAGLASELVALGVQSRAVHPPTVVLAGAASGQDDAARTLEGAGFRVRSIPLYRTIPAPAEVPRQTLPADARTDILVTSPSAVTGLLNRARVPDIARIISIGPTTTAAARAAGLSVAAEARRPGLAGLLEVL